MAPLDSTCLSAVAVVVLAAAATDVWKFKVPNVLTLGALAIGLAASVLLGGWSGLGWGLCGALAGFATLFPLFALGGLGAGDVKLAAALGAWLGPYLAVHVLLASCIAAGVYALSLALLNREAVAATAGALVVMIRAGKGDVRPDSRELEETLRRGDRRRRVVPLAAMMCVGFFATLWVEHARLDEFRPAGVVESSASTGYHTEGGGPR